MSDECKRLFHPCLLALHNQCLASNALYGLSALFCFGLLPGYWKVLGVHLLLICFVSYAHHTNTDFWGIPSSEWGVLDSMLSSILLVGGLVALGLAMRFPAIRGEVGWPFAVALCVTALYSLGLLAASRFAADRVGGKGDPIRTAGLEGPILAEVERAALQTDCPDQRLQIDYLSLHSAWHSVSAVGILFFLVAWKKVLGVTD